ncbi:MAG: asparagine synthase (glutamine-hydrolyzing) [Desulfarculaceae bacterium]|nr:asparagine synthase (glutamine-hydrolyzing) [Desulfarculaceae bacterium]MCF8074234.1 asparagine synthase (glutamine-hydrolyzing) [Desulfarculaceae bacterium]MCF8103007.1 asparagine synthase (glutamine-hydrolyzing) [Desulfarculaceae bacterium]MCF8117138.1 asparagine synthase (glutamine-hydrolyzing) [Desulfarculaceae bacterium]
MCGIAGFWDSRGGEAGALEAQAGAMAAVLAHRGPDAAETWADPGAGLALGHRRLSIIDLSPAGGQPMASHDGRWHLVYNGEIYNFPEIKSRLEAEDPSLARSWRGHSDTEVLLAALARWGVEAALQAVAGMFALALWDAKERRLFLARDRLGKKPLYYGWQGPAFLFASETGALRAHAAFDAPVDHQALALYLMRGNLPAPWSIYQGIAKLPPGCYLVLDQAKPGHMPSPRPYWSALEAAQQGQAQPLASRPEAMARLEDALLTAVRGRLISDVPLGALLSGGVDSSLVTALMAEASPEPVKSFSIGFGSSLHDEAPYARAVAGVLGSDHTELYLEPGKALELVPALPWIYGEPFADSSALPTLLVSALARQKVIVALSGDGGDELFGGYERYQWAPRLLGLKRRLGPLAPGLAWALSAGGRRVAESLLGAAMPLLPKSWRKQNPADNLHRLGAALGAKDGVALYDQLLTLWAKPGELSRQAAAPPAYPGPAPDLAGLIPRLMLRDTVSYLPDDILVKVDRASMAVSLELRCPLLDHRVFELAWRMPLQWKVGPGGGKLPLKNLLAQRLPRELIERPKTGFGVPLAAWLRGPLREWAAGLLAPARLAGEGYLRPEPIARAWREHQSGRRDWHHHLWVILMFQAWLDAQGSPPAPPVIPAL